MFLGLHSIPILNSSAYTEGQANDTYLSIEFVQRFQNKVHE